jgi:rhodanese-related sulfurtransferase/membrane protein insertase Oxa1/YidC/SpoIIIJ/phosphohistidine swiveling domain-containing protein
MRILSCIRRVADAAVVTLTSTFAVLAFCLFGTEQALAIPSPELVVGSFVSISQLFALASAVLGGGAAYATMRARRQGGSVEMSRGLLYTAAGLFAAMTVSIGVNIWQYVTDTNARQQRLEATLTRPMPKSGDAALDPALKEVSYAEQQRSPRGISTDEMEKLLEARARGDRQDTILLDIRETAETEMGTMPGAKTIRFPDVKSSGIDFAGKTAIAYCHNGNRGYETCQALAAMGIDCRFLIGGLEKWLVEKRPLTGLKARTLSDLRAVPAHRNQSVLLDTAQVRKLLEKDDAVFVDTRYPGEFMSDHLPNAINLPIRSVPTAEFKTRLAQLPKQPIIVPCYDRRSCFFGEVLGLEFERAGYDYRGRYTTPWEFVTPTESRPYIQEWLAQNNKGWFQKSAAALAAVLAPIADAIGLILTIILLACLSRLMILPFAVKAERDQIRAREAAAEMDDIKRRFKDDPAGKARAINSFYKRHGMTPGRNLIAMLFLPIMAGALLAVQDLASKGNTGLLWIPTLADRDPWLILPVIFGLLITAYVDLAFATSRMKRIVIWLVALPALTATGALLAASADIYLITSAMLLVIQRLWVSGQFTAMRDAWRRSRTPEGIVALDDVSRLENCGNKAYRLARMRAAGMPVPDGLVLTPAFMKRMADAPAAIRHRELAWIWQRLGQAKLAVRSSGSAEDGVNHSFAGVFESVIDVDRDGLEAAIVRVQASFETARVSSYGFSVGAGNILIQRMVDAEYSGVLFTRDPSAGGLAMVEMVHGTAENLVSGTVRPLSFRFGRVTKKPFGKVSAPIDLGPLLEMGDLAERLFGGPQDMEWTYREGRFHLVQSRDITRPVAGDADMAAMQNDLARAIDLAKGAEPGQVVFAKNELSEMLPRPTPLSLSLMESLWAAGGSVDLAARELGLSYRVEDGSNYLVTILGRLYINKREEQSRALVISALATRRLLSTADRIERDFRERFLPQFVDETRLLNVVDFEKLSTADLVAEIKRLHDRFVFDTHVAVDVINIAAGFYLDRARKVLSADAIDPSTLLGHIPETHEARAIAEVNAESAKSRRWLLLKNFGHRAVLDYELAEPRFAEDLNTLNRMVAGRAAAGRPGYQSTPALSKSQAKIVDIARRFQTLKEDAKHHSLGELAVLRRAVMTLDRRFGLDGRVFNLRFDELLSLNGQNAARLRELARSRQEQAQRLRHSPSLPSVLLAHDLEAASAGDASEMHAMPDAIRGTRVSGSRIVEARAYVIAEEDAEVGKSMEGFRDGDIVVASMINPAWLPYFSRAGGFVSEVGGWLSHPAILAREYDVTMIVGTEGIGRIANGARLRLNLDGRIEVVAAETMLGRVAAA